MAFMSIVFALSSLVMVELPASPDPKPIPIRGLVVDGLALDRPVAGADVWLAEIQLPGDGRRSGMELWWTYVTKPDEGTTPILVHTQTNAVGQFTLDVPAEAVARRSPFPLAVWTALGWPGNAYHLSSPTESCAGRRPAARACSALISTDGNYLLGPDHNPVASARVTPARFADITIPEPLGRSLGATTDATGRAILAGPTAEGIDEVRVEATGFGTQLLQVTSSEFGIPNSRKQTTTRGATTFSLAPVGRLAGRLVAPGNEPIVGVTVRAATQVGGYAGTGIVGTAEVTCDTQGRFEIPALAAGRLTLRLGFDPKQSTPLRGEPEKNLAIAAGRTNEITIPLRPTLEVNGSVVEKETNRPIAAVKVILNGRYGGDGFAISDANGKFAGRIIRELTQPYGWAVRIPAPFYYPTDQAEAPQGMPPRGSDSLTLPVTTLPRGVDVKGSVRDENNKPVTSAEVDAIWTSGDEMAQATLTRTDQAGNFTLNGVDPLAELLYRIEWFCQHRHLTYCSS